MSNEVQELSRYWSDDTGVVKLERWPDGFVVWFGGRIVFKSWDAKKEITVALKFDTNVGVISEIVRREIRNQSHRRL